MKAFYCHHFDLPLPDGHSFPMHKYRRLHEQVSRHAGAWGIDLIEPQAASDTDLLRVHCPDYVRRMSEGRATDNEMRRIGFPWSASMVERSRRSCGGTAYLDALAEYLPLAISMAGGYASDIDDIVAIHAETVRQAALACAAHPSRLANL